MSLRDDLGVRPDPDFDMDLPQGWARHRVDDDTLQTMLVAAKRRCMEEHKPHFYAEAKAMIEGSFDSMRRSGVFAYFCATDSDPGTLFIPASMNASIRRADPGHTLDDLARTLIRGHGATPLLGDRRTLRFEKEKSVRMGTETVVNHSVVYMTPVPGTHRRRALALVAGFARPLETSPDAESVAAQRLMFDACVASLRWRRPTQA